MELRQVVSAIAGRLVSIRPVYYLPDIIRQIRDRYGFVQFPMTPQELFALDAPLTFIHGRHVTSAGKSILIQNLKVAAEGIAVDTGASNDGGTIMQPSTDDADAVMHDLLSWATTELKIPFDSPGGWYISQLEVQFSESIDDWFTPWKQIGERLSERHTAAAGPVPPYRPYSFSMQIDPATGVKVPCDFRIERRVTMPFDSNVYFSAAPLSTSEHIALLEDVERLVGGAAKTA